MEKLREQLDTLINRLKAHQADVLRLSLDELKSVYPFSEYEYIISHLLAASKLTIDEYYEIRNDYKDRNLYLYLFEISAPRGFRDTWAVGQVLQLTPNLKRPSKKIDPKYTGEYDLWPDPQIKIEVKASRAVDFERPNDPLYLKALHSDSNRPFDMNFQQLKPRCCHLFIWIAAWRDRIRYWVLLSYVVEHSPHYSPGQHRGNVGEGQLHVNQDNIHDFDDYLVSPTEIERARRQVYKKELSLRKAKK